MQAHPLRQTLGALAVAAGANVIPTMARKNLIQTALSVFALLAVLSAQPAWADPLYGIVTSLQAYGGGDSPDPDEVALSSSSIPYSKSVSSVGPGSGDASIGVSFSYGNVGLHGFASANSPGAVGETDGAFDLFYYDTFYISGSGFETFNFTLDLNGTATSTYPSDQEQANGSFTDADGGLELGENGSYGGWGTVSGCCYGSVYLLSGGTENSGSDSGTLQLQGGTAVELDLYLWARTLSYAATATTADLSSVFDASDTAWLTLSPVTPGAGFTTASGLTYSASPETAAVPEPSSIALLGLALLSFGTLRRNKRDAKRTA